MKNENIVFKKDNNEDAEQEPTTQSRSLLEIFMSAIFKIFIIIVAFITYLSVHSATIVQNYEPNTFLYKISTLVTPIFVPLIILNIAIIIILIFTKRLLWLIIPCFAIAINWHIIPTIIQVRSSPNSDKQANVITLQSYNVHQFTYNSFENTIDNILISTYQNNVDILCFQEYTTYKDKANRREYTTIDERVRRSNNLYKDEKTTNDSDISSFSKSFPYSCFSKENTKVGLALFSVYPIVHSEVYTFPNSHQEALIADIAVNNTVIRIITIHLHTTSISQHHNEISILTDGFAIAETSYKLNALSTVTQAFIKSSSIRKGQADILSDIIKKSPHPVIVCGDFNDTPNSYTYHKFEELLSDAFKTVGSGYASSYASILSLLRIDYVFHASNITPIEFYYKPYPWSDHSSVFFKFSIPTTTPTLKL